MSLVHISDIEGWGQTVDARERLGRLLNMLIRGTLPHNGTTYIRFLHSTAMGLPGWDGIVNTKESNSYVALGKSLWELGAGNGKAGKVQSDYKKRLKQSLPDGWRHDETEYVAVTTSKLKDAAKLAGDLKKSSPWRDVRIIDAVELVHWLDLSATVDTWMFETITGRHHDGLQTLSREWTVWSGLTNPPIQHALVTVSRDANVQRVSNDLVQGNDFQIDADSPDEAIAFIYAVVAKLPAEQRDSILSRALVVSTKDAAHRFPANSAPQILILKGSATSSASRFSREGHHVVRVHGKNAESRRTGIALTRQARKDFTEALHSMGVAPDTQADIDARACGSSASVWRIWNLLQESSAEGYLPEWAKSEHSAIVIPAILMGGWSGDSEYDKRVVEALSGLDYATYRDKLTAIDRLGDPLLEIVSDAIVVAAPATAFAIVAKSVGVDVLARFKRQAEVVLSEIDPMVDVPPDQRMYAGINGQTLKHSEWLRDGVAETLLRIAVLGEPLERSGVLGSALRRQSFVDDFFRQIPGLKDNVRLVASLRDQLPVLAEAAPSPFLDALEVLLQGDRVGIESLFAEGGSFGGSSFHTGLLWALEALAWDPLLLGRVSKMLAELDGLDPGGRLSNRPLGSLTDIYLPWWPGTTATVQQRHAAVGGLLERYPDCGWRLLRQLMPDNRGSTSGTFRPEWRESRSEKAGSVPRKEVAELYAAYVDLAIENICSDDMRLAQMIEVYPALTAKHREALEARISAATHGQSEALPESWKAIRELISKHRSLADAAWALDETILKRLDSLSANLEPSSPISKHAWLFDEHFPDVAVLRRNHEARARETDKRRKAAVGEIWDRGNGADALVTFVSSVSYPSFIAAPLVATESSIDLLLDMFRRTVESNSAGKTFATALSGEAHGRFGDVWTKRVVEHASTLPTAEEVVVTAFLGYRDSRELFEFVASLGDGVEREFWSRHYGIVQDNGLNELVAGKLVEFGRARDALMLLVHDSLKLPTSTVIAMLDQTIRELQSGLQSRHGFAITQAIDRILEGLVLQPDTNLNELARIEYAFLPLLVRGSRRKTLALHDFLAADPNFYMSVICDLYKPDIGEREVDGRSDEERKARAHNAWQLLNSWTKAPGAVGTAEIDGSVLIAWVQEVRQIAHERNRSKIVDLQVGKILYHVPTDSTDPVWPHVSVRTLIEELGSDELESGFNTEQFNSRGSTSRAMYEGGTQERSLASMWRQRAEAAGPRWPRTQALLLKIAQGWEFAAEREDIDAEQRKLRYR